MKLLDAAKDWGWALAIAVSLTALTFSWLAFNPMEEAADHVAEPVLRAASILPSTCPAGWQDESTKDEHTRVRSCSRNGWIVILDADGQFDYGFQLDTPGAEFKDSPEEVPDWPK